MLAEAEKELLWSKRWSATHYLHLARIAESLSDPLRKELLDRFALIAGDQQRYYSAPGGKFGCVRDTYGDAYSYVIETGREFSQLTALLTACDDDALDVRAGQAADHCRNRRTLESKCEYATAHAIELPRGPRVSKKGLERRLNSADFWRGKLRRQLPRLAEEAMRRAGWVHVKATPYVSVPLAKRYRDQSVKTELKLRELTLYNPLTRETLDLSDIVAHSLANPKNRNAELMSHARGVQEYAGAHGHTCLMVTATCPSRFHARLREGGEPNPSYDRSTVRDAQAWLQKCWSKARVGFARRGLLTYGWRVAEPHHDGTPHWHLIVYCKPAERAAVEDILRKVWLREAPNERGAQAHRITFTAEDPERGSAVGYLAKYVAKNLEGPETAIDAELTDSSDLSVAESKKLVVIWARVHGLRQFQCFGQPVKLLWRTARRVTDVEHLQGSQLEELIKHCRGDLDGARASWCAVIEQLGGLPTAAARSRVWLDRCAPRTFDRKGRIVLQLNRWGEFLPERPSGIRAIHRGRWIRAIPAAIGWAQVRKICRLSRSSPALGPVTLTVTEPVMGFWRTTYGFAARPGPDFKRRVDPDAYGALYEKGGWSIECPFPKPERFRAPDRAKVWAALDHARAMEPYRGEPEGHSHEWFVEDRKKHAAQYAAAERERRELEASRPKPDDMQAFWGEDWNDTLLQRMLRWGRKRRKREKASLRNTSSSSSRLAPSSNG